MTAVKDAFGIDWARMQGSAEALKYARRDLPNLDRVVGLTKGFTSAVQAGGNLGIWPKRLAQTFATTYTFEPSPELFPLLVRNAPEPNIVRFQAALGCERGLVGVSRVRRDGKLNNHEGITHIAGSGCIPTLTVDDLNLSVCDLVYLDTEGWELYGLMGARRTLETCRPVVACEINKNAAFVGVTEDMVLLFLKSMSYRFEMLLGKDHVFLPAEWGQT